MNRSTIPRIVAAVAGAAISATAMAGGTGGRDVFTDGARLGAPDVYTDGARMGERDT